MNTILKTGCFFTPLNIQEKNRVAEPGLVWEHLNFNGAGQKIGAIPKVFFISVEWSQNVTI